MSEPGFTVRHDEMDASVRRLGELRQHAAGIIDLAADANPEWYIWGLLGIPMAAVYWSTAEDVYQHLQAMGEALADRVDALDATAQNYRGADDVLAKAIESVHKLLD